ncbi:hypothetical protein LTR08_006535 [Meristemomyces frigidus]|nr:hypothetical protein LTR08_006535 [Meristemomyces frigidus]
MAEPIPNGTATTGRDVDMLKEEMAPAETAMSNIQPAPLPLPPQAAMQHILPAPTPPAIANMAARPNSMPPQPSARPEKPVAHGGPTRQFLNQNITPHLLEGMKYLAVYEPEKPLLWLADFLKDRSKEVEG